MGRYVDAFFKTFKVDRLELLNFLVVMFKVVLRRLKFKCENENTKTIDGNLC